MGTSEVMRARALRDEIAAAAAYSSEEVPECVSLSNADLGLIRAADLPAAAHASLRFSDPSSQLGLASAGEARYYWDGSQLTLEVEHEVGDREDHLSDRQYRALLLTGVRDAMVGGEDVRLALDGPDHYGNYCIAYRVGRSSRRSVDNQTLAARQNRDLGVARAVEARLFSIEHAMLDAELTELVSVSPHAALTSALWDAVPVGTAFERGEALERLTEHLMVSTHMFGLSRRVITTTEEIDILAYARTSPPGIFESWGSVVLVECKNGSEPVGRREVSVFETKVRNRGGCRIGIMVSWSGFTRPARAELLRLSREPHNLLLLTKEDLQPALSGTPFSVVLERAYLQALSL